MSLKDKRILYLIFTDVIFSIVHLHFIYSWQLYFTGPAGMDTDTLGILYSLKSIMGIVAGIVLLKSVRIERGTDRNYFRLSLVSIGGMFLSYALFAGASAVAIGVIALSIYSLGEAIYFTTYTLLINEVIPSEYRSTILSTRMSISASVGVALYALIGNIVNALGIEGSFAIMLPVFLLLGAMYADFSPCGKRLKQTLKGC
ncbi:hypothetical protein [Thermococcus piezophilus]|uniref:Major facilitator superfamily (MFS) profile domain-containing protein n=1 Tax=Thermococcus piezophilus TaxID=1712654 RepID=A0A172WEW2_9EURY|nr:hypothetical protein A7C91_01245 [Thermococcus piezophilus]